MRKILGKIALVLTLFSSINATELSTHIDKSKANAYEQINLWYEIEGYDGRLPKDLLPMIEGVDRALKVERNGTKRIYHYALFAGKSFTVPKVKLGDISTKEVNITINPIKVQDIVDSKDSYKQESIGKIAMEWLLYVVVFALGFLFAKRRMRD